MALEIGIGEQDRAGLGEALRRRQRLALPPARQLDDVGTRPARRRGGRVARPVVGDQHPHIRELLPQRRNGSRDRRLLVACGDEDRRRPLRHPPSTIRGNRASAVGFTP